MYPKAAPVTGNLIFSSYYAPRGRQRLYQLGRDLSQRYLLPSDLLIGVIGAEGSGKSTLVKALFPGLELTNDDGGVNLRQNPLFSFSEKDFFSGHTFHLDYRYERAFRQPVEVCDAIHRALEANRRVIVEHFDLLFPALGYNAQVLFGLGEEVIVARPTVFGPHPDNLKRVADRTIKFRLMAHTAEDITSLILERDYNYKNPVLHSDVKHGFVISFPEEPAIDIGELEAKVRDVIERDLPVVTEDESHIRLGEEVLFCTGTRTHVKSTGKIRDFRLLKEYRYDPIGRQHLLVGVVGDTEEAGLEGIMGIPEGA